MSGSDAVPQSEATPEPEPESLFWQRDGSYAQLLEYHQTMLADDARVDSYRRAIAATVKPGDVVVDIGSGTGVLAFLACEAGAKKVYAIEGGPIIGLARQLAVDNGFGDRVEFLNQWSVDVVLPEPADVLITETIGNAGLDEGIVAWTADARRRLLRPGAVFLPQQLRLWLAPIESEDDHDQVADWAHPDLPFNYASAHLRAANSVWPADFSPEHLLGQPQLAADIDLTTVEAETTAVVGELWVDRDGTLHGLACWFDSLLCPGVTADNTPWRTGSSWAQGYLPLTEPYQVSVGDRLTWELAVSADGVDWHWKVTHN